MVRFQKYYHQGEVVRTRTNLKGEVVSLCTISVYTSPNYGQRLSCMSSIFTLWHWFT